MSVVVLGTGYVGLVTGACFAEVGNHVICLDVDERKIAGLKAGQIPIYEPGLTSIVLRCMADKRLEFSTRIQDVLEHAEICFIAVGTPPCEDGSADLSHVLEVASQIGRHMTRPLIVVDKSTVPVGTAERVRERIAEELRARDNLTPFQVLSNPEFLKEGAAIEDFMRPDRVIIGCAPTPEGRQAGERLAELYQPFTRNHERSLLMGLREAEMTKYAANCMLATKISFINEVAAICDALGVDVEDVRKGIGADSRIGYSFIYPGCGYGGSCFPKDVKALIHTAESASIDAVVLNAVEKRNQFQKEMLFEKIAVRYAARGVAGMRFALWGLAFKPGTDDVREAASLVLIDRLVNAGARVRAYDPAAVDATRRVLPEAWLSEGRVELVEDQNAALRDADALVIVTEWKNFRSPDFDEIKANLKEPIIFDGRNLYSPSRLQRAGFEYIAIGRGSQPATIF